MKPFILLCIICVLASVDSFAQYTQNSYGNQNTRKSPKYKSDNENYESAVRDFNKGRCAAAKAYYRLYKKSMGIVGKTKFDSQIEKCLAERGELNEFSSFDPETDNLSPLKFQQNSRTQPINNDLVKYGNDAFNNHEYEKAMKYYLDYIEDNDYLFEKSINSKELEQFLDKIEFCLSKLR